MSSKPKLSEDELFSLINETLQDAPIPVTDTFLSVINRKYREVYLSAILAYALKNDAGIIQTLCEEYAKAKNRTCDMDRFDFASANIRLEHGMDGKRADIFIEIPETKEQDDRTDNYFINSVATITIENKTETREHGEQTFNYRKWVEDNYPKSCFNCFFFLRPHYNNGEAQDTAYYVNIFYSDIKNWLDYSENPIINDFKKHIELFLEAKEMEFNENEKRLIENYYAFKSLQSNLDSKIEEKMNRMVKGVEAGLAQNGIQIADTHNNISPGVFIKKRYYDKDRRNFAYHLFKPEWKCENSGETKYYFYVEIRFLNENHPFEIAIQRTLKDYKTNNSAQTTMMNFIRDNNIPNNRDLHGQYHPIDPKIFNYDDWSSNEWENNFITFAVGKINEYIKKTEDLFDEFLQYKNNAENSTIV